MKKDEYTFLELFGNIDEEYIDQALKPWKGKNKRYERYHRYKRVAVFAVFVILGLSLIFHEQVSAAINSFTTKIAEILQLSKDLTPYTEVINSVEEKNGISITLNEVILTEEGLLASVKLDEKQESKDVGISISESVTIDGKEYVCNSSNIYKQENVNKKNEEYVAEWIFDDALPIGKTSNIEMEIFVHKNTGDAKGEKFSFAFSASKEELQKNTKTYFPNQKLTLNGTESVIKKVMINSVASTIELESDEIKMDGNEYDIRLQDENGNHFIYQLYKKEGKRYIFKNDGETPSLDNTRLKGQVYSLPYEDKRDSANEKEEIIEDVSGIYKVESEKMTPISSEFMIIFGDK